MSEQPKVFLKMSEQKAPEAENQNTADQQELDIQHDDEFEDFQVKYTQTETNKKQNEWNDDWDDDNVENFAAVLKEQRSQLN